MVAPDVPLPAHGFFPAFMAIILYVAVVAVVSSAAGYGLRATGLSVAPGLVALVVGALLLKPFLPLFRRLIPDTPEVE